MGATVQLTAAANRNYQFDHWEGDISGTANSVSVIMDKDKSVKAVFILKRGYLLIASVNPAGSGSIDPERGEYSEGTEVPVNASPNSGYKFDYWSGDINSLLPSETIVMNDRKNITANFKPLNKLTIEIDPVAAGTCSASADFFESGSKATITASPNSGFAFDHWGGNIGEETNLLDSSITVTVNENTRLTAYFTPLEMDIFKAQSQGFIEVIGHGSGYLGSIDVTITSKRNIKMSINIPRGTLFAGSLFVSKMINIEPRSILILPGSSKKVTLTTLGYEYNTLPGATDNLKPVDTPLPEALKNLLDMPEWAAAKFRVQQFSIFFITTPNAMSVAIGSGNAYSSPSQAEMTQINDLLQKAGFKT